VAAGDRRPEELTENAALEAQRGTDPVPASTLSPVSPSPTCQRSVAETAAPVLVEDANPLSNQRFRPFRATGDGRLSGRVVSLRRPRLGSGVVRAGQPGSGRRGRCD